jgi:hypothetical protein
MYFGPYALYVSTAFSALGLFFGLLGFMTERLFVENPVIETYIFRDYWSNVFSLGKNNRREMQQLDQKMTRAHIMAKDWWRQQIHRVKQTKPELIYVNETTAKIKGESTTREEKIGDVFDIASGQRLYDDVVDPGDLIGVYRPSILSIPAISNKIGGGRRLALEELVTRFLGWFIKSKALWVSYLAVSALFTYSLLYYFEGLVHSQGVVLMETDRQSLIITSVFLSALTIYFVFRFRARANTFTSVLEQSKKALLSTFISGKIEIGEMKKISYSQKHPPGWIEKYGLTGLAANFCSNLNWCY